MGKRVQSAEQQSSVFPKGLYCLQLQNMYIVNRTANNIIT